MYARLTSPPFAIAFANFRATCATANCSARSVDYTITKKASKRSLGGAGTSDACTIVGLSIRKRILLLSNEPRLTRLVRQAFEETGEYLIKEEADREIASETAQKFQPDVILLDLTDDELSGTEALEHIRSDWALGDAPIIALESTNGDASVVYSSSLEGYECSAGPIKMDELVHCVEEMLEQA